MKFLSALEAFVFLIISKTSSNSSQTTPSKNSHGTIFSASFINANTESISQFFRYSGIAEIHSIIASLLD
jgi:hypothetical protein